MLVILTAAVVSLLVAVVVLALRVRTLQTNLALTVDVIRIHARHLDVLASERGR